jgi:hypothetical protein
MAGVAIILILLFWIAPIPVAQSIGNAGLTTQLPGTTSSRASRNPPYFAVDSENKGALCQKQ